MVPVNPDLPSSWELPGLYFSINLSGQGASVGSLDKRLLLIGYKRSTGSAPLDQPVLVSGQADADAFFGQGSDLARQFAAAQAQVGAGVLDIWCLPIAEPSSGTQATRQIVVAGTATTPGGVDVYVAGQRISAGIAVGDDGTAIAATLNTEFAKYPMLPVTAGASGGTLTLTYRVKGLTGNDLPIRVDQQGASGVTFSPGTITYATAATGAGSATVKVSSTTITTPIANSDADTAIATNVGAQINAGGYPVRASVSGAVVTLLYASGRYVNGIAAAIVTTTGTTATVAAGTAVTDGGTQRPTLTTALTNVAALPGFSCWASAFTDTTTLGTLSAYIELQSNGLKQKGQMLHIASTDSLTVAGAIPAATTPTLTSSPRYSLDWCAESPQQAYELAARTAAMVCAEDYAPRNYDGKPLKTDTVTPLLLPARAIRPADPDQNAAIHTYHLTPLVVDDASGTLVVASGKTTSASADASLHDWGVIRHLDFLRTSFSQRLSSIFKGVNLRRNGVPHTPNTVTPNDVRDAALVLANELDAIDLYDGAEAFKAGFRAEPDPTVQGRLNCFIPLAVIRSLHQIGIVGAPV